MLEPPAPSDTRLDAPGTQGGDIVGVPFCSVCDATESPLTPLTIQPDGTFLCSIHLNARKNLAIGTRGASALRADGAGAAVVAAGPARPPAPPDSPYATLAVPLDATIEEIEAAYKKLQLVWLPRRASAAQRGLAEEMLESLSAAYDDLVDPERRRAVDDAIRKRALAEREARLSAAVSPLEDWPGRRVASLKEFEQACETSVQDWRTGEGILKSGGLFTWVRFSLRNRDAEQAVEQTQSRTGLSDMRRLNEFLYRIDPDRPYHFFPQPGVFQPIKDDAKVSSIESFITYADAHWDLAVQHLDDGELLTWLESKSSLGVYRGEAYDVRAFYEAQLAPYAHTPSAGMGLELLLEFLDPDLPKPALTVTFDGQENGYSTRNWDGELPHRAVTMTVQNTTRGYYTGKVILTAPTPKQLAPAPWISLDKLPLESPPPPAGGVAPKWNPTSQEAPCELKGATSRQISFYLGNFNALARGRTYTRTVTLQQHEPTGNKAAVTATFPINFRLMRFLSGYRLALWLRGLRGGIPGMILNGGAAFLLGWLIVGIGLAFAPQGYWTFFSQQVDTAAAGGPSAMGVLDIVLTVLQRPFYYAVATLGYQLPNLLAVFFGFFGLFTAWRRGHTKYTLKQDASAVRGTAWFTALCLWALATTIMILNLGHEMYPIYTTQLPVVGWRATIRMIAFVFDNFNYYPPPMSRFPWNGFAYYSVFFTGLSAIVVGRIIRALRRRLYKWTEQRSVKLLNPPERG